ncbi:iqgap-related protein [Elasticomyces elasticus]|nr:iqgap-related protein [Elasticomyces elasticus]
MSHSYLHSSRPPLGSHSVSTPSPLRQSSNASSSSSAYSNGSHPFPPSRTSTVSSNGSANGQYAGQKRGLSQVTSAPPSPSKENIPFATGNMSPSAYDTVRQALRPVPNVNSSKAADDRPGLYHARSQSHDQRAASLDHATSPPSKVRPHSMAISRSDSVRAPAHDRASRPNAQHVHFAPAASLLDKPHLEEMQKSTTDHLRTLSRFAEDGAEEEYAVKSKEEEVVGLHGRRRLQRTMSSRNKSVDVKSKFASGWERSAWIEQQRKFLQAYEYLCHIGEAKEWIEDIIQQQIPPIVQLEEALRDGVRLAEVVQALHPERPLRVFRNPRLQFRHSDNIALFFRFLAEVELPELFRFELVDLYEKKNIPKVIYCIHALSWLLFRKGIVDFRIGNLVGQLKFEDHELEAMQKGLDKAGVSMPNFSGMSANFGAAPEPEPEPEPVETEADRIERELAESEEVAIDLQAQIRGAMARMRLGNTMQELWDVEGVLIEFQSRVRGDWARQVTQYRLDMRRFAVELQGAVRGFLVRSRREQKQAHWKDREKQVVTVQKLFRGRKARAQVQYTKSRIQQQAHGVRGLQAFVRGALARWNVGDQYHGSMEAESEILQFQAAIRGFQLRQHVEQQLTATYQAESKVTSLQAAIRAALSRRRVEVQSAESREAEANITKLQAAVLGMLGRRKRHATQVVLGQYQTTVTAIQSAARALLMRRKHDHIHGELKDSTPMWTSFQGLVRGQAARRQYFGTQADLKICSPQIIALQAITRAIKIRREAAGVGIKLANEQFSIHSVQSLARATLVRKKHFADLSALKASTPITTQLQALIRGSILREHTYDILCELNLYIPQLADLQSRARQMLLEHRIGGLFAELEQHEDAIIELQAAVRGKIVRVNFAEKQRFFKENMQKVIKIQSFVRGRQQGEAYKSLTSGKNPPVGTVKNFVHLLNDSDFDFDEELEFERLRKTVVQHVQENEMAEQYIDQLDIKIALLVKNKITLDEVVKHQKHFGGHVGSLLTNKEISSKDSFDLKALNRNSRRKLEHYQELFFVLQTQPQYLARLFRRLKEQGLAEKEGKRMEMLMMGIFGFAQKRREEYYLLKLIARSIKEEVEACPSLQEYLRGNFFWSKLFAAYIRSPRDRKYMRDLFGPLVREQIFENEGLDLESDPLLIYRSAINNEELRTGQRSRRQPDLSREEAIRDPETRETFIAHLQDLRDIADQFFALLEETLLRMPYGVRYVVQQMYWTLSQRFSREDPRQLMQIAGNWFWKTYLLPALTQPEMWGVIDRGLSPMQKRNLGEVAKVLGQVCAGKLFGGENVYLQPLNTWMQEAMMRLDEIWATLINVRDAERHFDIDEFNDLYARLKPTLYIKMADIFAIHQIIASEMSYLCSTMPQDDVLRDIIRELGSAKNNENEMRGVSTNEISLTLSPKLHNVEDPEAEVKALFMETKRLVLYIIRIQSGANLLEIMVRPITWEDEDRWIALIDEELRSPHPTRNAYSDDATSGTQSLLDIKSLTYVELKATALENILRLESAGKLSRSNHYQDLLNAIALDIRTKHRRRVARTRELEGVRATLAQLDAKAQYLESQLKSYNDYVEQAMVTLQNKKGKKRFLLPFTKQYNHERELARSGRVPKFGSFKYSARALADKGVLVSWSGYVPEQWGRMDVTISSDQVGVFHVEGGMGSTMIPGASEIVKLDRLLQAQFDGQQFLDLFLGTAGADREGGLRLNVNLFLHTVFKKFYRDE